MREFAEMRDFHGDKMIRQKAQWERNIRVASIKTFNKVQMT